ncbi:MAG: DHA2 family efflux MFS transporter permease subunit [Alphaproteobacteria bacterium]
MSVEGPPPVDPHRVDPIVPDHAGPGIRARFAEFGAAYPVILLATMLTGAFATMLAATIINVALPSIIGAFGLGQDEAQWLSTGFLAASMAAMLTNAWAVAAIGVRNSFAAAMVIFAAGSFLGAAADSLEMLVVARIMQGVAAGFVQPLPLMMIFQTFAEHRRGAALGIFSLGVVMAPALGPLIGGMAMDVFDWRFVFLVTAPLALVSLPIAVLVLPRRDSTGKRPPFDAVGLALLVAAAFTMLAGLANGNRTGWSDTDTILRLMAAGIMALAFIAWEMGQAFPVLNLRLFTNRTFVAGGAVVMLQGFAIYGSTFLIPLFVQGLQGYSPTQSGLLMVPAGMAMLIGFPLAGALSDRIDPRWLILAGMAVFGFSAWLMSGITLDTSFGTLVWWLILSRIGISLVMPTGNRTAIRDLPPDLIGAGAGAASFFMQFGGALGVIMLALLLQRRTLFHGQALASATNEANVQFLYAHEMLRLEMLGLPLSPLQSFQSAFGGISSRIAANAGTMAFQDCFLVTAVMFVGGIALALSLPRRP